MRRGDVRTFYRFRHFGQTNLRCRTSLKITVIVFCQMSIGNQSVVQLTFDVSVHDHVAVQVGHSLEDLPGVSAGHLLRQSPVGFQLVLYRALRRQKEWGLEEVGCEYSPFLIAFFSHILHRRYSVPTSKQAAQ